MSKTLCRHCCRKPANRPRGLCWPCYYRPGVRNRYPSGSKFAVQGTGNLTGTRPLPAEPTDTRPGSDERIEVLAERAARGEALRHPDDETGLAVRRVYEPRDNDEYEPRVRRVLFNDQ